MEQIPYQPWKHLQWSQGHALQVYPSYMPSWEGWKETEHKELNSLKEHIDAFEKDGTWEQRKKLANIYELVYTHDEKKTPLCLATAKPLSRSYFKMIEMLHTISFFQRFPKVKQFRTTHVCEGPGGFIQAFCEEAQRNHKNIEVCLTMTLRPTHSHIPGWKRASQFLRKHPEVKISYGADGTGDIYSPENQAAFQQEVGPNKSHLFTADGGFDFKMDYMHQEQIAFRLIVASFAIAFETLLEGGVCIVKLFDTFGNTTQEFIGFVSCFFKTWTLYKPAMSRPCNSERYFIGMGFRGTNEAVREIFTKVQADLSVHQVSDLESLFKDLSFTESIEAIKRFQQTQEEVQIQTLKTAIQAHLASPWDHWKESYKASELWCKTFPVSWRQIISHDHHLA
jgi:23S rRNA U2552 (ribose-2'-O)-methylase RlmE/FtsJ